jgi:hypothetical protein
MNNKEHEKQSHVSKEPVSERLLAGSLYESELIKLLYEIDAGENVECFEVGSESQNGGRDESIAQINELLESLGVGSRRWVGSLSKSVNPHDADRDLVKISDRHARGIQLEGLSIGEFFTDYSWAKLPIERNEDAAISEEICFDLQSGHTLRLQAQGSLEFVYPDEEEEDQGSMKLYTKPI